MTTQPLSDQPRTTGGGYYRIYVAQQLDPECSNWLAGMTLTRLESGGTLLHGYLVDQSALYGVLQSLRDLNLSLLELHRDASEQAPACTNH